MTTTGIGPGMDPPGTGQSAEDGWIEPARDLRTIVEDLQSGMITQSFVVPGRPDEAYRNQHIGGLAIGTVHPWFRHTYLVRREFKNYIVKKQEQNRRTMVTATYRTRPCPQYPEISSIMTLSSMNMWWSYDDPPRLIDPSPSGFPILQPHSTLTLHWPAYDLSLINLLKLRDLGGRLMQAWDDTGEGPEARFFFGEYCRDMLFDGMTYKLLFGPANFDHESLSRWELAMHFRIDRLRHHQKWTANFDKNRPTTEEEPNGYTGTGFPLPVATLAELFAGVGHLRQTQHPAVGEGEEWDSTFGNLEANANNPLCRSDELNQIGPDLS